MMYMQVMKVSADLFDESFVKFCKTDDVSRSLPNARLL